MGYINILSCQCGYQKNLKLGTGRHIPDTAYINQQFSPDKLNKFHAALKAGILGHPYYIENILCYCKYCNDIKEGKKLHYQVNNTEMSVNDYCDTCGNELDFIENEPLCPQCGKALDIEMNGLWD